MAILQNIPEYRYLCPAADQVVDIRSVARMGGKGEGTKVWVRCCGKTDSKFTGKFVCATRNNLEANRR